MTIIKKVITIICIFSFYSCAEYKRNSNVKQKYYSSSGFALIYNDELYDQKVINKKVKNDDIYVLHNFLKLNTPIRIINPDNSNFVEAKINKKGDYPKIFNIVISNKIASELKLDFDNPYVEIVEVKKNKKFIAKKGNTFEEERNVALKVTIDEIKVDDLNTFTKKNVKKKLKHKTFTIKINDFYFEKSVTELKNELLKKTKFKNMYIKKINNKQFRLLVGPFNNFNALKIAYISLNNLGFENLNIYNN